MRALLVVMLLAGCAPELRDGQFTCGDGVCPEDFECCGGICRPSCDADAGMDAGGTDDGGGVDAGGADAEAADASGLDAGPLDSGDGDAGDEDAGRVDAGGADAGLSCGGGCASGQSCHTGMGVCIPDFSLPACEVCTDPTQCTASTVCSRMGGGQYHCHPRPNPGCPANIYVRQLTVMSIEGSAVPVCLPPDGVDCFAVRGMITMQGCTSAGGCLGMGSTCDLMAGQCSIQCAIDDHCPPSLTCRSNVCSAS